MNEEISGSAAIAGFLGGDQFINGKEQSSGNFKLSLEKAKEDSTHALRRVEELAARMEDLSKSISGDIKDVKRDNLNILSIFVAVIAFLFGGVEIIKEKAGLLEKFILLVGQGAVLVGFVWLVHYTVGVRYDQELDKDKHSIINSYLRNIGAILRWLALLLLITWVCLLTKYIFE